MDKLNIKVSELRHKIKIQEEIETEIDKGFETVKEKVWIKKYNAKAKIKNINGKEFISSDRENNKITTRIIMRYRKGITENMRVKFKDTTYNIIFSDNWEERNIWLILYCEVVK